MRAGAERTDYLQMQKIWSLHVRIYPGLRSSINIISGIPELTIELSRIGKNFNQIVRAVYLHPQSLEASELARIADDLDAIKDLITELKENTIHADH